MRRIISILLQLLVLQAARSQTYNFRHYTEEDGLGQAYIYHISQSREGLLLLSSGEAFTTFDGKRFTSFSYKRFAENMVPVHFIDSRNVIWFGHQQSGLSFLKDGEFAVFDDSLITGVKVHQVAEDKNGDVWLATSGGVFKIDLNFMVTVVSLPETGPVNAIAFHGKNRALLGTSQGLYVIDAADPSHTKVLSAPSQLEGIGIKQLVAADEHHFWVLTEGDGIYCFAASKYNYGLTTHIKQELDDNNRNIPCIYNDRAGNLWASVFGDGLRKLSFRDPGTFARFSVEKVNRKNGLPSDNIQSIYQDTEGNIWFGTFGEGLVKKPVEVFSFYAQGDGITLTDVKKVLKDKAGNLWMGTDKGLAVLKSADRSYKIYHADNGFVTDKVTALYQDSLGILWIGTSEHGIYKFDPGKNKFENFSAKKKLLHTTINVIMNSGDKIMAGTTDGLYVFDQQSNLVEELSTNDGLFHNNVLNLFRDSKERLWICSHGTPPYYIRDQKITPFKKLKGLDFFNINAVCEDTRGIIWIATDGDGVYRYDGTEFKQYTTEQGLLSDFCIGIETDHTNAVWVTHRQGSSALKQAQHRFVAFNHKKGLLFHENNTNAIYKDDEGYLWFGTRQGVVKYDARSGVEEAKPPAIFISAVKLNEELFHPGDAIEKDYAYYAVHIDFKAVSLSDPGAIYYKYRLLDVDSNFRITNNPSVDVPKLGDGTYVFEVVACNENTRLCSSPSKVTFTILKPFWKHIWFYVLLSIVIVSMTQLLVFLRTRSLKKTQALLEMRIEQKTELLKREKEAVEAVKVQLEHRNKDITDSIQYAKNLQDSLLPQDAMMDALFRQDCFVLYKPKDIVSGDFYWCASRKSQDGLELSLAGVVDCTGHGVPGAFLSILANDFLKQSLSEKDTVTPDKILGYLNAGVSSHFNQQHGKNKIRDGMDIALVGIDYAAGKLYYAGANNPVYVFRQVNDDCVEEIIIKATKQAIGAVVEVPKEYELTVIDLQKGDMIYLFSDGYADQFGGPRNKKLTYKAFRTILTGACRLPVSLQKQYLENMLEEWKKDTEQTDDVCVMGIRF